jgi:hypothetical protein
MAIKIVYQIVTIDLDNVSYVSSRSYIC